MSLNEFAFLTEQDKRHFAYGLVFSELPLQEQHMAPWLGAKPL